jgi:hypothetical protein
MGAKAASVATALAARFTAFRAIKLRTRLELSAAQDAVTVRIETGK